MPQPIVGMELNEIQAALGPDLPAYRSRQAYQAVYRRRVESVERIPELPAALRARLAAHPFGRPVEAARFDSLDGTRRYLLRLADNRTIETVLMPEESRDTICISTQIGCAVDCRFCLTARMGLERNLTAGEIVGQVLHVARAHSLDPRQARVNVVMMGMGEPLLNLGNVLRATRLLTDPEGVGLSPRRITLSTAGIVPKIAELGREAVRPKLAISLNASTEEQRQELMPITRKYHLKDLMDACRAYPLRPWERLTFEYVLLGGVNDSDADARRVVRLLARLKAKVNLIPLNPTAASPYGRTPYARVKEFEQILREDGIPTTLRVEKGIEIAAGCGQLRQARN